MFSFREPIPKNSCVPMCTADLMDLYLSLDLMTICSQKTAIISNVLGLTKFKCASVFSPQKNLKLKAEQLFSAGLSNHHSYQQKEEEEQNAKCSTQNIHECLSVWRMLFRKCTQGFRRRQQCWVEHSVNLFASKCFFFVGFRLLEI